MTSLLNSLDLPWYCSNLFFWKGKGQLPFLKVNHPKPRALVEFEPRTEPELSTRDSHLTTISCYVADELFIYATDLPWLGGQMESYKARVPPLTE